jgi:hypothetical protein
MVRRSRVLLTRTGLACLSGAIALLAGACGSSQPSRASATPKLVSATTMVSDAWPIADHIVTPATFPGLVRPASPSVISSPRVWAAAVERSASPGREAARLRALGFVRAIDEQLHARFPVMAEAISIAEQYRGPAGARAELGYQYWQLEHSGGGKVSAFPVGIPGAHGVRVTGGGIVGLNVLFSAGPYYYVVAAGYPSDPRGTQSAAGVAAAAETLYLAVTGCSAPRGAARAG